MAGVHGAARAAGIKDPQAHALFASILEQVKNGERVFIKNFGSFFQTQRAARTVTSPQIPNGKAEVPEHLVMRFRPSPYVKAVLNGLVAPEDTDPGVEENDGDVEGTEDAPPPKATKPAAKAAKAPPNGKKQTTAAPKRAKRGPGKPAKTA